MKALLKNDNFLTLVATVAILTAGVVVLPLLVALGCKVLMLIFTKPVMALVVSSAFLTGVFVGQLKS